MDTAAFKLPPVIESALQRLSERSGLSLFKYGGFLRDRALGLQSRDLDMLVHGQLDPIKPVLQAALGPDVPLLSVLPKGGTNLLLNLGGEPANQINQIDLIDMPRFLHTFGRIPSEDAFTSACQVADTTDFTVNAIVCGLGSTPDCYAHPLWEADMAQRTVRLIRPELLVQEYWLIFKAVRLEQRLGGKICPETEEAIRQTVQERRWKELIGEKFLTYLFRSLKSSEPWKIAARLWELDSFNDFFPTVLPAEKMQEEFLQILNDPTRPSLGADGKSPWLVGVLLKAQLPEARRRFFERLRSYDKTQFEVVLSRL